MKDGRARDEKIERPLRITRRRKSDQRCGQDAGRAAGKPDVLIQALKQQGIGEKKEVEREEPADTQTQVLDSPAMLPGRIAEHLLDEYQTSNRGQQGKDQTQRAEIDTNPGLGPGHEPIQRQHQQ